MYGKPVVTLCGERTLRQKLRRTDITVGFVVLNVLVNVQSIMRKSLQPLTSTDTGQSVSLLDSISSLPGNTKVSVTDAQRQGGDVAVPIGKL